MWANPIEAKYLLVINIHHHQNPDSTYSVDQLWHKDLQIHRFYLSDLRLASPRKDAEAGPSSRVLEDRDDLGQLTHVPMPDPSSLARSVLAMPRTLWRLWKAVGDADVVHVGVGGWPYPLGWPAALFTKIRGKFLIVVVESAPWRLGFQPGVTFKNKVLAHVYESMANWSVNQADMSLFTQAEYRSSLLRSGRPGLVTNATWIDDGVILSDAEANRSWEEKSAQPLRLLFAGRVTESKGISPMIEAILGVAVAGVPVHIDIMGEGDRLDDCKALAQSLEGPTTVGILPPVPYGAPFFDTVRRYHAVLVPSIADEQPRIIYDAYSQAVPVIASDTAGIRDCATDGETAILVAPGDPSALVAAISRAAENPEMLRKMGWNALKIARKKTHSEMHRVRHSLLRELLSSARTKTRTIPEGESLQPSRASQ